MNLLVDPVFRVRTQEGRRQCSLPALMELLGEDRVEALPGLQRHQEDAFHVFLCYLAGAVLTLSDQTNPRQSELFWRKGIRALTRKEGCDDDSAWTLVVADATKPAFMQSPAPSQAIFDNEYRPKAVTPDALDVMQTAKNHDVKAARALAHDPEAWIFALISLQTTIGFLGAGNQGIARMNGGFGSRPFVCWSGAQRFGARWLSDVGKLLSIRPLLLQPPYSYRANGNSLLWVATWDGASSFSLEALDPFFIEIARRIRLVNGEGGYMALGASCSKQRIAANALAGNVGDPWIPINNKTNGALTVPETGLTPALLRDLIFADGAIKPAAMQEPHARGSGWLNAAVLVRGKGTTDGFHEASIRIPERAQIVLFGGGVQRDRLAKLSKQGLDTAKTVSDALRFALYSVMEGGPQDINFKAREVSEWVNKSQEPFAQNWNPRYFEWLWGTLDASDEEAALRPWFMDLRLLAQDALSRAMTSVPLRHGRSYRARTKAQGLFIGSLFKHFPQYMETTHDHS